MHLVAILSVTLMLASSIIAKAGQQSDVLRRQVTPDPCATTCSTFLQSGAFCTTPDCLCTSTNQGTFQDCLNCLSTSTSQLAMAMDQAASSFNLECKGSFTLTAAVPLPTIGGSTIGADDDDDDSDSGSDDTASTDGAGSTPTSAAGAGAPSATSAPVPNATSGSSGAGGATSSSGGPASGGKTAGQGSSAGQSTGKSAGFALSPTMSNAGILCAVLLSLLSLI
ncbi:hypothetical protein CPC08DRAFT_723939 [Agrocybe pediades]|nr:hypothetical protein CPC08DRAFT_723939 [Agrocybe pediades]